MLSPVPSLAAQRGFSLLEVLVTIVVLAFGLLGLAGLQMRSLSTNTDAYQRTQAQAILSDMAERLRANQDNTAGTIDANYLTGSSWVGTGVAPAADCTALALGQPRDTCEWSKSLLGTAETSGTSSVGAMLGARGCIVQLQAPNPTKNICTPGIYGVTVAWQGMSPTVAPPSSGFGSCAAGQYGSNDAFRRVVSARVIVALNQC